MSGRARGRHTPRTGDGDASPDFFKKPMVDPDSPEGHKLGMSKRVQGAPSPIPGGKDHILNAQTFRQKPAAPDPAEFTNDLDQNAHGVPPHTHTGNTRAQMMRGRGAGDFPDQYYAAPPTPVKPIPVWVVENQDKGQVFRASTLRRVVIPATGDPTPLCGMDPDRVQILLLNESAQLVRIAQNPADLTSATAGNAGAALPASMGSYLRLPMQDSLYAVSATGTAATLSVIQIFDHEGSGL